MKIEVENKSNKYAIVRVNLNGLNEIVGIYSKSSQASNHVKRLQEKHGYKKESISCKWEDSEVVKNSLDDQINIGLAYQRNFNTREGEQEILMMKSFIKEFCC